MKNFSYYLKASLFSLALFLLSYLLLHNVRYFVSSQEFFAPTTQFMIGTVLLFLMVMLTAALLAGSWDRWEQFVFTPVPITAAIFLTTFSLNSGYAVIFIMAIYAILAYDLFLANQLKRQMLVFNPRLILKFTTKGTILAFSLTAAIFVILGTGERTPLNIGREVGEIVDKYITPGINKNLSSQFGLTDTQADLAEKYGFVEELEQVAVPELSLSETVSSEVNRAVEPYKQFLNPIIALLMFGLIQFLGGIAYFFYTLLIDLVFYIAKKSGLFIIERVPAEKEILHF